MTGRNRVAPTASSPASLQAVRNALLTAAGELINEAADLGEDGHYEHALRREAEARAYLNVIAYLDTGTLPEIEDEESDDSPSDELAERFEVAQKR